MEERERRELDELAWGCLREGRVQQALQAWATLNAELRRCGRYEHARGVAQTMICVSESTGRQPELVALYAMAETLRESGALSEAAEWVRKAERAHEQLGDARRIACDWAALGEIWEDLGEYSRAVDAWSRAAMLFDAESESGALHDLMVDLSRAYALLGEGVLSEVCAARAERLSVRWASA